MFISYVTCGPSSLRATTLQVNLDVTLCTIKDKNIFQALIKLTTIKVTIAISYKSNHTNNIKFYKAVL